MKANRLLHAIGQVDSEFIEKASPEIKYTHQNKIKKILAAAACFAVIFSIGIGLWHGNQNIVSLNNTDKIYFHKSNSNNSIQLNSDIDIITRELKKSESEILFHDLSVTGIACFDKNTHEFIGIDGKTGETKLIVSLSGMSLKDTVIEGNDKQSIVNGIPVYAGYFLTDKNSQGKRTAIYYADFEIGDKKFYVEKAGDENEKDQIKNELASVILKLTEIGNLNFEKIS